MCSTVEIAGACCKIHVVNSGIRAIISDMAFDFNEARAIIEEAKKKGQILPSTGRPASKPLDSKEKAAKPTVIPDWLQENTSDSPSKPGVAWR
jgi:hypothetical protein